MRSLADAIGRAKLALAPASAARLETPFRNFSNNPATVFDAPEPLFLDEAEALDQSLIEVTGI